MCEFNWNSFFPVKDGPAVIEEGNKKESGLQKREIWNTKEKLHSLADD